MRGVDDELVVEQGACEAVEQCGPVARVDLDHGEAIRGLVVDDHPRANVERLRAAVRQRPPGEARDQLDAVRKRVADGGLDTVELRRFVKRLAVRILDEEIVDRPAGAGRVDARIDDVGACQMDTPCDTVEQARVVRGDHAHQRRPA